MHMLGVVVHVVKMNDACLMCFYDVRWQQQTLGYILGDLTGHVVPLDGINRRIFVGILLLDLFVVTLYQR
ncbi:hypothetical protein D3C81_1830620 [compost metagenome]